MRCKLICCEVFLREACLSIGASPYTIDPEFTPKGAHDSSSYLRELIQSKIDETEEKGIYEAIILGFGLCGNSIIGLKSKKLPLVIPRAHDCCTIFLGSRAKFIEHFSDKLSAEWSTVGYMERGENYTRETDTTKMLGLDLEYNEFVKLYGEDNAEYIWETLHPKQHSNEMIYIDIPETSNAGYKEMLKLRAEEQGKDFEEITGDIKMIQDLLWGNWDSKDFLIVPPGCEVKGVYDQELVITV